MEDNAITPIVWRMSHNPSIPLAGVHSRPYKHVLDLAAASSPEHRQQQQQQQHSSHHLRTFQI